MNDDNTEELFRRAAINYQLKTDTSDWESVAKKLPDNEVLSSEKSNKYNTGKIILLVSLLLVPMLWLCNKYTIMHFKNVNLVEKQPMLQPQPLTNAKSNDSINAAPDKPEKLQFSTKPTAIKNDNSKKSAFTIQESGGTQRFEKGNQNLQLDKKEDGNIEGTTIGLQEGLPSYQKFIDVKSGQEVNDSFPGNSPMAEPFNHADADSVNITIPHQQVADKATAENKKQPIKVSLTYMYAGFLAGADITTVKYQAIKNAGYSIGLVLGHPISKRISLETGLLYNKKFYYSDGQYFKSSYNNSSRKFTSVTGNCNMWEVPVSLKINFNTGAKTAWFASAGLSSYIIKKEQYDYKYLAWGMEYAASYTNKTSSAFLFSALNLGIGYQHYLGNSMFRFEPYFKIPLRGIGTGKLPVTSTGINMIITKKMW